MRKSDKCVYNDYLSLVVLVVALVVVCMCMYLLYGERRILCCVICVVKATVYS
jgi:hypothetical protein